MRSWRWTLAQCDWCLCKKRRLGHTHTQRKDHVKTEGEGGCQQAKKRGHRKKNQPYQLPWFWISSPHHEKINFYCFSCPVRGTWLRQLEQTDPAPFVKLATAWIPTPHPLSGETFCPLCILKYWWSSVLMFFLIREALPSRCHLLIGFNYVDSKQLSCVLTVFTIIQWRQPSPLFQAPCLCVKLHISPEYFPHTSDSTVQNCGRHLLPEWARPPAFWFPAFGSHQLLPVHPPGALRASLTVALSFTATFISASKGLALLPFLFLPPCASPAASISC